MRADVQSLEGLLWRYCSTVYCGAVSVPEAMSCCVVSLPAQSSRLLAPRQILDVAIFLSSV